MMRAPHAVAASGLRVMLLSAETQAMMRRPIRGRGGFQALLRRIQTGMDGELLWVDVDDLNALVRSANRGRWRQLGGFQRRVVLLLADAVRNELACPEPEHTQLPLPFAARRPPQPLRVIRGGRW